MTTPEFVTSDLHFMHKSILDYTDRRGLLGVETVDEHDAALVSRWNAVVGPHDTVWIIGDICMGIRRVSLELVKLLNGTKFLIPGNHDDVHPMFVDQKNYAAKVELYVAAGLQLMPPQVVHNFEGQDFLMCHFPYTGDSREEDRFPGWRPVDDGGGMVLLHGHVHSSVAYRGRQCDVGIDAWGQPTPLSTILGGF